MSIGTIQNGNFSSLFLGMVLIRERKIGTDEVIEFEVLEDKIEAIHILLGYTHNIINCSETENFVTLIWENENLDPVYPNTFLRR